MNFYLDAMHHLGKCQEMQVLVNGVTLPSKVNRVVANFVIMSSCNTAVWVISVFDNIFGSKLFMVPIPMLVAVVVTLPLELNGVVAMQTLFLTMHFCNTAWWVNSVFHDFF